MFSLLKIKNEFKKTSRYLAFTLAEVLISMAIIGIVAEMVIPELVETSEEKIAVTQLKEAFSIFSQALKMAEIDNGSIASWGCTGAANVPVCVFDIISPYLAVAKNCGGAMGQGCFPAGINYKKISGGSWGIIDNWQYGKARLKNGMSFFIMSAAAKTIVTSNTGNLALNNIYGELDVDINGDKGPNTNGKDLFVFYITAYGIVPAGSKDENLNTMPGVFPYRLDTLCSNKSSSGDGCAAWVIYNENMDYLRGPVSW